MGRHTAEPKAQEEFILQTITREVERMFRDHPRRSGPITAGMSITLHHEELRRDFSGTVVRVDPLHINWRY